VGLTVVELLGVLTGVVATVDGVVGRGVGGVPLEELLEQPATSASVVPATAIPPASLM
jgi:hypothetical protein